MGLLADLTARSMQRVAPRTVSYGDALYFSGTDLPAPVDLTVPTRHGGVRCEVYRPDLAGELPVYAHFHGGAFVMRYPAMDDFFCRLVAAECGAVVVNVDYDVAPQVRYPVAQEQAHDVLEWLSRHGDRVGGHGARLAVGGFSAGGNLAAAACLQARDRRSCAPVLQVLGVPSLDVAEDITAKTSTTTTPMISPALLRLVRRTYFKDSGRRGEAYASPLLAGSLAGLPPALVLTGEHDVLRAEGDRYAHRLGEAGIPVTHRVVPGVDHYFLDGGRTQAREVLDLVVATMRDAYRFA